MAQSENGRHAPDFVSQRTSFVAARTRTMNSKTQSMKTNLIIIIAAVVLLPTAAFTQPHPPPPPAPPAPPTAPVGPRNDRDRDRNEKKVPVTYLGVETSDVPRVVS